MEIRRQKQHAHASLPSATCLNQPTLPKCSATGQISSAPGQAKFGTSQLLCGPRHCMPQGRRPLLHAKPSRDKPCVVCHIHVSPATAKPMSATRHVLPATAHACLVQFLPATNQISLPQAMPAHPQAKSPRSYGLSATGQAPPATGQAQSPQAKAIRHWPGPVQHGRGSATTRSPSACLPQARFRLPKARTGLPHNSFWLVSVCHTQLYPLNACLFATGQVCLPQAMVCLPQAMFFCHKPGFVCHKPWLICHKAGFVCHN